MLNLPKVTQLGVAKPRFETSLVAESALLTFMLGPNCLPKVFDLICRRQNAVTYTSYLTNPT